MCIFLWEKFKFRKIKLLATEKSVALSMVTGNLVKTPPLKQSVLIPYPSSADELRHIILVLLNVILTRRLQSFFLCLQANFGLFQDSALE
jgi:hypothetical protein